MAHIEKVKQKEMAVLLNHDARCYDNHSNKDIRVEDKYLNYNFIKENPRTRFNKYNHINLHRYKNRDY